MVGDRVMKGRGDRVGLRVGGGDRIALRRRAAASRSGFVGRGRFVECNDEEIEQQ